MPSSRSARAGLAIKRKQERNALEIPHIEARNNEPRRPELYGPEAPPDFPKSEAGYGSPDLEAKILASMAERQRQASTGAAGA